MKLLVDRKELTGPFGGKYYESHIKLEVSQEERDAICKHGFSMAYVVGCKGVDFEQPEAKFSLSVCGKWGVTVHQLIEGVEGKARSDSDLPQLIHFENTIKTSCKGLKASLENAVAAKKAFNSGSSSEEL